MKEVPFYGNHEDDLHCMLAVYGSVIEYFLRHKLDWPQLEGLTGYKPGKAAWSIGMLTHLDAMGFSIRMIEPFDYKQYKDKGNSYLEKLYAPEDLKLYKENSNILQMRDQIPAFLSRIHYDDRQATLKDIDELLAEDRLIFVSLNGKTLNGEPGFSPHAILVIDKDGDDYVAHDPGLPPNPNRRISPELLWKAMGGDKNVAEVTGIKLKNKPVRADVLIANMYPLYSRAALAKLFDRDLVLKDGQPIKAGAKIAANSNLSVDISPLEQPIPAVSIPIIYEDDDCIVMNKPSGMLTHAPGTISNEATVATFLREKLVDLEGQRGGIVHRLDRATSGIIIGAKTVKALSYLQKQFADRSVKKTYAAVIAGHIEPDEAVIDMPIERNPRAPATFRVGPNGKSARTHYKVIEHGPKNDLVELYPATGRTHQLRVHLAQRGHPIVGDPLYGKGKPGGRLYLHAEQLEIRLPNGEQKIFTTPVPEDFKGAI
jgi:23S rRNA pseudouridine1911/1915/1917 synthase